MIATTYGLVCACAMSLAAQSPAKPAVVKPQVTTPHLSKPQETKHLTVVATTSAAAVAPGATVSLFLDVAPKALMHVYAPEQKGLVPVSLKLAADAGVKALPPKFPKSEPYKAVDEVQAVYSKPFRIVQDVTVPAAASGSTITVNGTLRYQACDDKVCYLPVNVPVAWSVGLKARKR